MSCNDETCYGGWRMFVQVHRKVYQQSHAPNAEEGRLEVERLELARETHYNGLNYDQAWAHDRQHEVAYQVVRPCPTCKPNWIHPDLRPEPEDEEKETKRRVRQVAQADADEDWGPPKPYKDA